MCLSPACAGVGTLDSATEQVAEPSRSGAFFVFPVANIGCGLLLESGFVADGFGLPKFAPTAQRAKRFWADSHTFYMQCGLFFGRFPFLLSPHHRETSKHFVCQAIYARR